MPCQSHFYGTIYETYADLNIKLGSRHSTPRHWQFSSFDPIMINHCLSKKIHWFYYCDFDFIAATLHSPAIMKYIVFALLSPWFWPVSFQKGKFQTPYSLLFVLEQLVSDQKILRLWTNHLYVQFSSSRFFFIAPLAFYDGYANDHLHFYEILAISWDR